MADHQFSKIPEDWRIGEAINELYMKGRIGWQGLKKNEFLEEGNYLVTGIHFTDKNTVNWEKCFRISDLRYNEAPEIQLRPHDVLITKDGTIGKIAFLNDLPGKASLNSHLLVLRPLSTDLLSRFLYYQLLSTRFKRFIENLKTGSTLVGLSQANFGKFPLIIPDIEEQQGIISVLSTADNAIDQTDQMIQKYQCIKQGLMQDLFRYGVDKQGNLRREKANSFRDTPFGRIPVEWKIAKIGEVLSEVNERIQMRDTEIYRLISIRRRNGGIFERERLPGNKILTKDLHRVIPRTFLIANRQIVHGACAYVSDEFADAAVSTAYTSLKGNENCDILWFSWLAKTPLMYKYFLDASQGVVLEKMNFHVKEWFELPIALPPVPEQSQIVRIFNQIEDTIKTEEMYKQKLIALKSGLMDDLLSGKLRVNHMIPAET